ncbi:MULTISPECIES: hypothetical protein [unclassified Bartonella]|uniref:hypothetical protein n=1 Tax=unclassified Bartonella TaxID=2645622 RepID=UPI00300E2640
MLKSILKITAVSAVGVSLVACSLDEQRVAGYGVGGAALGALAGTAVGNSPDAALTGAALGAVAGTVTGVAVNQKKQQSQIIVQQPQMCTYRSRRGRVYQAPCPQTPQTPQLCTYRGHAGALYQAPCR